MPRNSSGTYTLPAGNPVAPNTIIETAWANPTMSDIGAALTDSLDRFGRGSMLAPIKAPDGTAVAPVYSFVAEATMGMYRSSAGVLGLSIGGAAALLLSATTAVFDPAVHPQWAANPTGPNDLTPKSYVDTLVSTGYLPLTGGTLSGPLNITYAAPVLKLTQNDAAATNFADLQFQANDRFYRLTGYGSTHSSRANQFWMNATDAASSIVLATANLERVRVDTSGNVGIGRTPQFNLDVGTLAGSATIAVSNANNTTDYGFFQWSQSLSALRIGTNGAFPIRFDTGAAQRMLLDTSGNLGIGRTPTARLDVAAPDDARLVLDGTGSGTGSGGTVLMYRTGAFIGRIGVEANTLGNSGTGMILQSVNPMLFHTGPAVGTEAMRISTSQQVGIGVAPSAKFHVRTSGLIAKLETTTARGGGACYVDFFDPTGAKGEIGYGAATDDFYITNIITGGNLFFGTQNVTRMTITAAGVIQDAAGLELGYRSLYPIAYGSGASTLNAADNGRAHYKQDASNITVPNNLPANAIITIYNASGSPRTIVQGAGATLLLAGTTSTGNRTLAVNGIATVWALGAPGAQTSVISGSGLS